MSLQLGFYLKLWAKDTDLYLLKQQGAGLGLGYAHQRAAILSIYPGTATWITSLRALVSKLL